MKYRKKPVVIEAVQWFKDGDHPAVRRPVLRDVATFQQPVEQLSACGVIGTLENPQHLVTPGDWIITGVKGENYACKPDIFAMTYEPAEAAVFQIDQCARP